MGTLEQFCGSPVRRTVILPSHLLHLWNPCLVTMIYVVVASFLLFFAILFSICSRIVILAKLFSELVQWQIVAVCLRFTARKRLRGLLRLRHLLSTLFVHHGTSRDRVLRPG